MNKKYQEFLKLISATMLVSASLATTAHAEESVNNTAQQVGETTVKVIKAAPSAAFGFLKGVLSGVGVTEKDTNNATNQVKNGANSVVDVVGKMGFKAMSFLNNDSQVNEAFAELSRKYSWQNVADKPELISSTKNKTDKLIEKSLNQADEKQLVGSERAKFLRTVLENNFGRQIREEKRQQMQESVANALETGSPVVERPRLG